MAAQQELEIEQYATYKVTFWYKDQGTGQAIDLTGHTAKLELRREYSDSTPALSLSTGNGLTIEPALGKINLEISATQTSAIAQGRYFYDLVITKSSQKTRIIEGIANVSPGVTR